MTLFYCASDPSRPNLAGFIRENSNGLASLRDAGITTVNTGIPMLGNEPARKVLTAQLDQVDGKVQLDVEPYQLKQAIGRKWPLDSPEKFYRISDHSLARYQNADFLAVFAIDQHWSGRPLQENQPAPDVLRVLSKGGGDAFIA